MGKKYSTPTPTNLPHAAPVNNNGMNTPDGTFNPNVHTDKEKYSIAKISNVDGLNESKKTVCHQSLVVELTYRTMK